jgi:hypothetical protein
VNVHCQPIIRQTFALFKGEHRSGWALPFRRSSPTKIRTLIPEGHLLPVTELSRPAGG